MVNLPPGASWEDLPGDGADYVPSYDTAEDVDDALSAAKARFDHGDAPYDPDVLGLIRAAEAMREKLYGPVAGDPMPRFVIGGKDKLARAAVAEYHNLCLQAGLRDQAAQVFLAMSEIIRWQARNPGHVKLPDHEHVPVAREYLGELGTAPSPGGEA
jgi:hypothetical protein